MFSPACSCSAIFHVLTHWTMCTSFYAATSKGKCCRHVPLWTHDFWCLRGLGRCLFRAAPAVPFSPACSFCLVVISNLHSSSPDFSCLSSHFSLNRWLASGCKVKVKAIRQELPCPPGTTPAHESVFVLFSIFSSVADSWPGLQIPKFSPSWGVWSIDYLFPRRKTLCLLYLKRDWAHNKRLKNISWIISLFFAFNPCLSIDSLHHHLNLLKACSPPKTKPKPNHNKQLRTSPSG